MQITSEDKYYITLPLFHAQGLAMMTYGTMIAGASAVLTRGFRASTWISDIKKYGATLTNLLGAMNDFVLAQPKSSKDQDNQLRQRRHVDPHNGQIASRRGKGLRPPLLSLIW